jgi:hypothetical protein
MNASVKKRLASACKMGPEYAESVKRYLASIGTKGGKAKSEAKAAAAKANGAKGGRPRKSPKAETPSEPANTQLADKRA